MYDAIDIYPCLQGERDASCVSLDGLCNREFQILIVWTSPAVVNMSKWCLGTNEVHWVWMVICHGREVSHADLLADRKQKRATLCSERRRLRTRNIRNIYNLVILYLISGDGNDYSFILKAPGAVKRSAKSTLTHPPCDFKRDRINMGTQDPKKQNL